MPKIRRVLGVDPGYANVGLSILEGTKDTPPKLIYARCFAAGTANSESSFLGITRKIITELHEEYGFEQWATEVLPVLDNLKTTLNIRFASGILWDVAHHLTGRGPRLVAAQTVKSATCRILDIPNKKSDYITKAKVGEAVLRTFGTNARTHHENDAALVALCAFYPKWIQKQAPGTCSPSKPLRKVSVRA